MPVGDAQPTLVPDPVSNGKRGKQPAKKTARKAPRPKDGEAKPKTRRELAARAS